MLVSVVLFVNGADGVGYIYGSWKFGVKHGKHRWV